MTPPAAEAAIKSRLNTEWATLHSGSQVTWPNDPLPIIDPAALHIRAEVQFFNETILSLSGTPSVNDYVRDGTLIMRVFGPSMTGTETIRGYAHEAAKIFRGWINGDLFFNEVAEAGGGHFDRDGLWFQIDVLASFTLALGSNE